MGGGQPAADPANALQALVSRLRRALEAASSGERLVSRPSGYLLAVEPDQVDALRFERLCRDGHEALAAGQHRQAAATLREALKLWRGQALAEFAAEPFAAANAARLEELRLGALENRIEADMALGEHARQVGELEALAAEHPLRERPHALLMRALARRAGRPMRSPPTSGSAASSPSELAWTPAWSCGGWSRPSSPRTPRSARRR